MFEAKERSIGSHLLSPIHKNTQYIVWYNWINFAVCEPPLCSVKKHFSLNVGNCVIMWFKTWQMHSLSPSPTHTHMYTQKMNRNVCIRNIFKFCRFTYEYFFLFGFWTNVATQILIYANPLFVLNWTAFRYYSPKYQYWLMTFRGPFARPPALLFAC